MSKPEADKVSPKSAKSYAAKGDVETVSATDDTASIQASSHSEAGSSSAAESNSEAESNSAAGSNSEEGDELAEQEQPLVPPKTLGVVLAAGPEDPFGKYDNKLCAKLASKPLLWWATQHCLSAGFDEVIVIEGSYPVKDLIPDEASIVTNHDWSEGQAISLHVAVRYAELHDYEAVVVGYGDQPLIPPASWRAISNSTAPITVARYGDGLGPPIRFGQEVWPMIPYEGVYGARLLVKAKPELVTEVKCVGSSADVDAISDLDRVRRNTLSKALGTWT